MDPLSDVLLRTQLGAYGFRGLDAGGDWAIDVPAWPGLKCYAIEKGRCWIELPDEQRRHALESGDLVLVPGHYAVRLSSGGHAPGIDALTLFEAVPIGTTAIVNGGGACVGMGGFFKLQGHFAERLLRGLPPIVHIAARSTRAALLGSIDKLMGELRDPRPGSALMGLHLAQALMVEALRLHLQSKPEGAGWLAGLADRRVARVLAEIHAHPKRRWTLKELADRSGMSRSGLAARFKTLVGQSPIDYLTQWRLLLAAEQLTSTGARVSQVAADIGYESESAFGNAFKRAMGSSPKKYAARHARGSAG